MEALGYCVFGFAVIKLIFMYVAALTKGWETDENIRVQLSKWIDVLRSIPLHEIVHRLLFKIRTTFEQWYPTRRSQFILMLKWSGLVFVLTFITAEFSSLFHNKDFFDFSGILDVELLLSSLCIAIIAVIMSILSFIMTWSLLSLGVKYQSNWLLIVIVMIDCFMAYSAYCLSLLGIFSGQLLLQSGMGADLFSNGVYDELYETWIIAYQFLFDKDYFAFLLIAVITLWPTLLYITLSCFLFAFRLMPDWMQRFLTLNVSIFTRSEKPVFVQLGTVFGLLGGLLAGVLNLL